MVEEDLLSALQELLEASGEMTGGALPSASQIERYQRARAWAQRLVSLAEKSQALR